MAGARGVSSLTTISNSHHRSVDGLPRSRALPDARPGKMHRPEALSDPGGGWARCLRRGACGKRDLKTLHLRTRAWREQVAGGRDRWIAGPSAWRGGGSDSAGGKVAQPADPFPPSRVRIYFAAPEMAETAIRGAACPAAAGAEPMLLGADLRISVELKAW